MCDSTVGSYEVNGQEIHYVSDPLHLLKNMRNNFMEKYLEYKSGNDTKLVKIWDVIETA